MVSPDIAARSRSAAAATCAWSASRAANSRMMSGTSSRAPPVARSTVRASAASAAARRGAGSSGSVVSPGDHSSPRAKPSASLARRIAVATAGANQVSGARTYSAIGRQPLHQHLAGLGGAGGQVSRCGQGASGFTWSGVTGETPPQSSSPAADQLLVDAGRQVGRRLDVHRPAQHQPRRGDGPEQVVEPRFLRRRQLGARLGAEILDDDFLDMAVPRVEIARSPAAPRSAPPASRRCRSGCRW